MVLQFHSESSAILSVQHINGNLLFQEADPGEGEGLIRVFFLICMQPSPDQPNTLPSTGT